MSTAKNNIIISHAKKYLEWKSNPIKFMEECIYIPTAGGDELFKLYEPQKRTLKNFFENNHLVILKSRQTGMSTLSQALVVYLTIFYENYGIGIISRSGDESSSFNRKALDMLNRLQTNVPWLHPGYMINSARSFKLKNKSFLASSAISRSNPTGVFRGSSILTLFVDEAAYIEKIDLAYGGITPALSKTATVARQENIPYGQIILSTPSNKTGIGQFFFQKWGDAVGNPDTVWSPERVHWREIPEFADNKEWYKEQCALLGNDPLKIATELELEFIDAENSLFTPETQKSLSNIRNPEDTKKINMKNGGTLTIYRDINEIKHKLIIISCDTASAFGKDNSIIEFIISETMEQIAEYAGKLEPKLFAETLKDLSNMFPNNIIIVESNSYGTAVLNELQFDTKKLYNYFGEMTGAEKKIFKPGLTTTVKTRPLMIDALHDFVSNFPENIKGESLALEILSLINKNGKLEAPDGFNDDRAMAYSFACYVKKYCPENLVGFEKEGGMRSINEENELRTNVISMINDTYSPAYDVSFSEINISSHTKFINELYDKEKKRIEREEEINNPSKQNDEEEIDISDILLNGNMM